MSDKFPGMTAYNNILGGINVTAVLRSARGGTVDPEWLIQQEIDVIVCQDEILRVCEKINSQIVSVQAPVQQGAKTKAYLAYAVFLQRR